jgi:hypothetical protein
MQNNTHTSPRPTWRDFADDLTFEQVGSLASSDSPDLRDLGRRALLFAARDMARHNRWASEYRDVAAPADATLVDDWHPEGGIENQSPARYFDGVRWPHVHMRGVQNPDGTVRERWITVDTDTDDLDAAGARALARFLTAAADELEQVAFAEAIAGWHSDTDTDGVSYRDACAAGVAVVCADADALGAVR